MTSGEGRRCRRRPARPTGSAFRGGGRARGHRAGAVPGGQRASQAAVPGGHVRPERPTTWHRPGASGADERWSDHPACTHPLLAAVDRQVNDHTSDAGRQRLAELIPSVIGLTGDDLHIDARIALGSATVALPVVAAERQRVMAVSVLTCERVLARGVDHGDGPVHDIGQACPFALEDGGEVRNAWLACSRVRPLCRARNGAAANSASSRRPLSWNVRTAVVMSRFVIAAAARLAPTCRFRPGVSVAPAPGRTRGRYESGCLRQVRPTRVVAG